MKKKKKQITNNAKLIYLERDLVRYMSSPFMLLVTEYRIKKLKKIMDREWFSDIKNKGEENERNYN